MAAEVNSPMRLRSAAMLLVLVSSAFVAWPPTASAWHCDPWSPTTVTTSTVSATVPIPGSVGPYAVPQQTVGGQTVGPVPTGLQPITVTVYGQSASVPLDPACASQTVTEEVRNVVWCVRDILSGYPCSLS